MNEATANISWLPFDPRDWVQLTPAFGRLKSVVAPHGPKFTANNYAATYFDRYVHEGLLELILVAPDLTYRRFDAAERQKLTIRVPLNYEEGCSIEPYYDGHWYVRRSDLEKLTAIPVTPAARAEAELVPARTPPAPPTELLRVEPGRDVGAAGVPVQGTQMKPGGPQFPPAAPERTIAGRKKAAQEKIAEAVKKIWPPDGIVPLDLGPADLMHAVEDLYKREAAAKGPKEKPRKPPSWSSCKRFLEDQRST
jgi:hypothetical protein